jgi:hypothetical protein
MTSPDLAAALERVSVATVRPGETLLISAGRRLSRAEADEWSEHLRPLMPEGVKFAIFDDDITITVVRPGEPS